jgi:rod shape-determining protein MreD
MNSTAYVAVPVMIVLAVLQSAVFPFFTILGFVPLFPFLVSLAWGLLRGANEGVVWAFVAGFFLDLFSTTPMGTSSIAFMTAVFIVVAVSQLFPGNPFFLPILQAIVATVIFLFVHLLLLRFLGHSFSFESIFSLLPIAFLHGILILPIYWLLRLVNQMIQPRRVKI